MFHFHRWFSACFVHHAVKQLVRINLAWGARQLTLQLFCLPEAFISLHYYKTALCVCRYTVRSNFFSPSCLTLFGFFSPFFPCAWLSLSNISHLFSHCFQPVVTIPIVSLFCLDLYIIVFFGKCSFPGVSCLGHPFLESKRQEMNFLSKENDK